MKYALILFVILFLLYLQPVTDMGVVYECNADKEPMHPFIHLIERRTIFMDSLHLGIYCIQTDGAVGSYAGFEFGP